MMRRFLVVTALLLILPAYTLAGAVGGPKSGHSSDHGPPRKEELSIKYEGGEIAVIAVAGHARRAPDIEVFDPTGKRVVSALGSSEQDDKRANFAVWMPEKTGVYRIKISYGADWSYKTN
jgi:hypothetical protein